MDFLLFMFINIILLFCLISGIALFLYMINQLINKKYKIAFNYAIVVYVLILFFNSTNSTYESKLVQKEIITQDVIVENYIHDIQNVQTKSSGYNKYRLLNVKNGNIIKLSEDEFVKLKCEKYNIIFYNILREYTLVGIKINFASDDTEYRVNCINKEKHE